MHACHSTASNVQVTCACRVRVREPFDFESNARPIEINAPKTPKQQSSRPCVVLTLHPRTRHMNWHGNCLAGLQILLFIMVNGQAWAHALLIVYYYLTCLVYGFGTLVVAFNTTREFESHTHALEHLRMDYLACRYLGCRPQDGNTSERVLAKDVCLQAKEARRRRPGAWTA
jgi:hypothetical protein